MSDKTEIAWCDSTFNGWMGCTKVGPGCDHCYAERDMDHRYGKVNWGAGNPRSRTSEANWKNPIKWNKKPFYECGNCGWRGEQKEMVPWDDSYGSVISCPKCHQGQFKHARRRVFCSSLSDVFDNEVDPAWRMDLFSLIAKTPNLDWLLLTKRIGNVMPMCSKDSLMFDLICERVWLGITVVNQLEADRDIPKLMQVPAHIRFLSMEPLLEYVSLDAAVGYDKEISGFDPFATRASWVITGGESGPGHREFNPDWARSLRDQCKAAEIPFFMKQMSAASQRSMPEIPEDLQVRKFPK